MAKAAEARFPPEMFINGLALKDLKEGSVVVDVGGNVGSVTLHLYKAFPKLNYVVQDLEQPIVQAGHFWQQNAPEAIASGNVKLQANDFFTPQPIKGASIYFLRVVIHDWSDDEAKKILKQLRESANDSTKLVIFDILAHHVCADPVTESQTTAAPKPPVPAPLLANLGIGGLGGFNTQMDMQMLNMFNGKERTEQEFRELGVATGWKLETVVDGLLGTFTFSPV
ncbi:hypothetical protein H0H93_010789 [Arthromyces matolae]|nr:hypothetical protein H0H93_010789 [Arthromyces matolae]